MQPITQSIRENRLAELLIEASPAGILMTDPQGIIALVNQRAEAWFGYEESELIGKPVEILVPGAHRSDHTSHQALLLSQPRSQLLATRKNLLGRRKNGTEFSIEISLHSIMTVPGHLILANFIELTNLSQGNESHVQSERLAGIFQMVTGLAHESHNALQRAQGCLDLLELDLVNQAELLNLTDRIRVALTDLHRNYEEVRNYAAPIVLKYAPANLIELCRATFDDFASDERRVSKCQFVATADPDACAIVDVTHIKHVFQKVFENAIAASFEGTSINVVCHPQRLRHNDAIEITIHDHGCGLDAETAGRMFEPFYTTKQHGTGLGLAICQRIIKAHRGEIDAANHPLGGTVVRITLPIVPPKRMRRSIWPPE